MTAISGLTSIVDTEPLRPWVPPPTTSENLEFADLRTIDLSLLDSPNPKVVDNLIRLAATAIRDDGFLYLVNYGVSPEQLQRQFEIAQFCLVDGAITQEEKARLCWHPQSGSYAGYKPRNAWKLGNGAVDQIEHFNFYSPQFEDEKRVPQALHPFMSEIRDFAVYCHDVVNRRLLCVLSRVLEMPDDYLWDKIQSHNGPVGEGYYRHMLYHPLAESEGQKSGGVMMQGHTDFGTTTMLFSQPISALQLMTPDNKWKWVKHTPGAMVINIGDTLEVLSGGNFKATRHRVSMPPQDQRHLQRLGIVLFNAPRADFILEPELESPVLKHNGYSHRFLPLVEAGKRPPTADEWRSERVRGSQVPIKDNLVIKDGVKFKREFYQGVWVDSPV